MHEEVGLQEDQVQLVRSGRPLFVDSGRLHFTVHPFLFHLTDPEARVRCWRLQGAETGQGCCAYGIITKNSSRKTSRN